MSRGSTRLSNGGPGDFANLSPDESFDFFAYRVIAYVDRPNG